MHESTIVCKDYSTSTKPVHKKLETNIEVLNEPERIEEIARMISGKNITEEARAAANSLLLRS